jgi:hypothetical protein
MSKAETQEVTDSGRSDATDTSTNDLDDRSIGDDWDADDASFDSADDDESKDDDDSAATDEDDDKDSEDVDDVDESTEEDESGEDLEDEDDSDSEEESDATDDKSDRKRKNDAAAKARIEAKQAREAQAKAEAEAERLRISKQEEDLQRYLEEAGDDELERERRELAIQGFRQQEERIGINRDRLASGIERAVAGIDLFRTGTQVQKDALADSLDDFEAMYIVKDKQDRPLEVKGDVVAFLTKRAESISKLAGEGVKVQQKQKS